MYLNMGAMKHLKEHTGDCINQITMLFPFESTGNKVSYAIDGWNQWWNQLKNQFGNGW